MARQQLCPPLVPPHLGLLIAAAVRTDRQEAEDDDRERDPEEQSGEEDHVAAAMPRTGRASSNATPLAMSARPSAIRISTLPTLSAGDRYQKG